MREKEAKQREEEEEEWVSGGGGVWRVWVVGVVRCCVMVGGCMLSARKSHDCQSSSFYRQKHSCFRKHDVCAVRQNLRLQNCDRESFLKMKKNKETFF